MTDLSRERLEELREIANLNPFALPSELSANDVIALLDMAERALNFRPSMMGAHADELEDGR